MKEESWAASSVSSVQRSPVSALDAESSFASKELGIATSLLKITFRCIIKKRAGFHI